MQAPEIVRRLADAGGVTAVEAEKVVHVVFDAVRRRVWEGESRLDNGGFMTAMGNGDVADALAEGASLEPREADRMVELLAGILRAG